MANTSSNKRSLLMTEKHKGGDEVLKKRRLSLPTPPPPPPKVGRVWVGGTARGIGYAKPSQECGPDHILAPIISRGPSPWKSMSPFFLKVGHLGRDLIQPHQGEKDEKEEDREWHERNVPPPEACVENVWQFAKVYENVQRQRQTKGTVKRGTQEIVWQHPEERHAKVPTGHAARDATSFPGVRIEPAFHHWRAKGWTHKRAVRRPNGTVKKGGVPLFSLWGDQRLNYIDARKTIYLPVYQNAVRKTEAYQQLLAEVASGKNILLIDVDGPNVRKFPQGREATHAMLAACLEDPTRPFGHGYACAMALLADLDAEPVVE